MMNQSNSEEYLINDSNEYAETSFSDQLVAQNIQENCWNNVKDLDDFFNTVYNYHKFGGYQAIFTHHILVTMEILFATILSFFVITCVNFDKLASSDKLNWNEFIHYHKAFSVPSFMNAIPLIIGIPYVVIYIYISYGRLKKAYFISFFYEEVLEITSSSLGNYDWPGIIKKLILAQKTHQINVYKPEITELDIHQRILRKENYLIGLHNKNVLDFVINFPILGQFPYLSRGLKFNIERLLFQERMTFFESSSTLKISAKNVAKRDIMIKDLSKKMMYCAILNFVLCPILLLHNIVYAIFSYISIVKLSPRLLSSRVWTKYTLIHLRGYNEIENTFKLRLQKGYEPTMKYLEQFTSPITVCLARTLIFIFGSLFSMIIIFSFISPYFYELPYIVTILAAIGICLSWLSSFVPSETQIIDPIYYYTEMVKYLHYLPVSNGNTHSDKQTRDQISALFPYRWVVIISELLSPIFVPFILGFYILPKVGRIVDFFREESINIQGVGDVCTMSVMKAREAVPSLVATKNFEDNLIASCYLKPELSLLKFKNKYPDWKCPQESQIFIDSIYQKANEISQSGMNERINILNNSNRKLIHREGVKCKSCNLKEKKRIKPSTFSLIESIHEIYNKSGKNHANENDALIDSDSNQSVNFLPMNPEYKKS